MELTVTADELNKQEGDWATRFPEEIRKSISMIMKIARKNPALSRWPLGMDKSIMDTSYPKSDRCGAFTNRSKLYLRDF